MAMTLMQKSAPLVDSIHLVDDGIKLRKRARTDGYLYLRGLLDPEKLGELNMQILKLCRQLGWLDEARPLSDAMPAPGKQIAESKAETHQEWFQFYDQLQRLRAFHAMAQDPRLMRVLENLFGEPVLAHPRNIARVVFPGASVYTTPPHQDHIHIRGTPDTWTTWFPTHDCPRERGGLAIWPGSHQQGMLDTHSAYGAGGRGVAVPEDTVWVSSDLKCGDVLLFHSWTVHQGMDNLSDRLRISVDYRYQARSQKVDFYSLVPHIGRLSWDDIYSDWPVNDPLRYYWRNWALEVEGQV